MIIARLATIASISALSLGAISVSSASAAPQDHSPGSSSGESDSYVLSNTYKYDGHVYGPEDGVEVHSGSVVVGDNNSSGLTAIPLVKFNLGSSYAKSTERLQLWYDGEAYASGKKDFRTATGVLHRVIQVCFKYTQGGENVIGWQCSNAGLGPLFPPGAHVKKTVRDSLNPVAPKTIFHYSYKTF